MSSLWTSLLREDGSAQVLHAGVSGEREDVGSPRRASGALWGCASAVAGGVGVGGADGRGSLCALWRFDRAPGEPFDLGHDDEARVRRTGGRMIGPYPEHAVATGVLRLT